MTRTQTSKGQRVEVRNESGVEYGTVVGVYGPDAPQVDVRFDDDTFCTVAAFRVRPFDGFDAWCARNGRTVTETIDGEEVVR